MSVDRARAQAEREYGDVAASRRELAALDRRRLTRERVAAWWAAIVQDTIYAFRTSRRVPGASAVVLLCLAVGIGVNTVSFGAINALALQPLPGVVRQDRLVSLYQGYDGALGPVGPANISEVEYRIYRDRVSAFDGLAAAATSRVAAVRDGEARYAVVEAVSANYFPVLGVRPAVGRLFAAGEDGASGGDAVVVVSDTFWRNRLGQRADAVGSVLVLNGRPFTVVGVAPARFTGLHPPGFADATTSDGPTLWILLSALRGVRPSAAGGADGLDAPPLRVVGRLRSDGSAARAAPELAAAAREVAARFPRARRGAYARLAPLGRGPADPAGGVATAVLLLMSGPATVLLVVCANLANLQLARGADRAREITVRVALGATRARLVRQFLAEAGLYAVAGGGLGLAAAAALVPWVVRRTGFEFSGDAVDRTVVLFTAGVVVATTFAFGLVPALRATAPDLTAALKQGTAGAGAARSRLHGGLVVGQIALSAVVLTSCGLFVLSARRALDVDLGYRRERLILATVDFDVLGFGAARARAFQVALVERVRALPEVEAVGLASTLPLATGPDVQVSALRSGAGRVWVKRVDIAGDFVGASGLELRAGTAPAVGSGVAVTEELAHALWPGARALGQRITVADDDTTVTRTYDVQGVIRVLRARPDGEPERAVFVPAAAVPNRAALYVRTRGAVGPMVAAVRRELRATDPKVPAPAVLTAEALVRRELRPARLLAQALGGMGVLALVLAAGGVYALMTFLVARRTREIGVRAALGASRATLARLVLGDAVRLATVGTTIGLAASVAVAALLRGLLIGGSPFAPGPFAAIALVLVGSAVVAAWVPARRAARVDPAAALRGE